MISIGYLDPDELFVFPHEGNQDGGNVYQIVGLAGETEVFIQLVCRHSPEVKDCLWVSTNQIVFPVAADRVHVHEEHESWKEIQEAHERQVLLAKRTQIFMACVCSILYVTISLAILFALNLRSMGDFILYSWPMLGIVPIVKAQNFPRNRKEELWLMLIGILIWGGGMLMNILLLSKNWVL